MEDQAVLPEENGVQETAQMPSSQENPSGIQVAQGGATFINEMVLSPDCDPMGPSGKILADQAAGMMMQDVTSFSQGIMQIMTAAIAKATAEVVATDAQKGKQALETLTPALAKLPSFVSLMANSAQTIEGAFNKKNEKGGQDESKSVKKRFFRN